MRGVYSNKTYIRRRIFSEIAKLAYEGGGREEFENLPYKILPGEIATYRDSIFLERAIVGERLRVAMGMPLRTAAEHAPISQGIDQSLIDTKYYEPPLVDVIKFACHSCPEKRVYVTDGCQGCLEHPCQEVCPKGAISTVNGKSFIDQTKCIKCGRCADSCAYNAIIKQERPCMKACGVGAIHSDEYGRAEIDHEKCVSCGQCLVSCPFAAIVDKGQIYQTIQAIKSETPVYAIVAPAVAGQFGPDMNDRKVRPAFRALGFTGVYEVAIGADLCTIEEAQDFLKEVPAEIPYMGTSCCPAWSMMIRKNFPDQAKCISMALTPMVLTARLVKERHPNCKICFIGPCAAKKLEASRRSVKSYVDFVLTFEEAAGMFDAKDVDFKSLPEEEPLHKDSGDGRGFAQSGGVAKAVVNYVHSIDPDKEVKVMSAEGLQDCKKMMMLAKAGKYNGYLLEGMACPGGCIAGAGTMLPILKAQQALAQSQKSAAFDRASKTEYADLIPELEKFQITSNKVENMED